MKNTLKDKLFRWNSILALAGILTGAIGGYLYYYFVGCRTGTCPLTSNPWLTVVWGATVGYLIFDMFRKKKPAVSGNDKQVDN
ncbi:MAG TPA: DUF6132 family protein [Bacteroidales bacterium]|jgi:xanthine/uracil permease|nr:DUF6132 family protein [Bacteroidales bacterium]HNQ82715.1 DUF6132 family protein [Bacteroidales bacterium]HOX76670.1 DUF6132 family protein [Bacteroidales bacterium]